MFSSTRAQPAELYNIELVHGQVYYRAAAPQIICPFLVHACIYIVLIACMCTRRVNWTGASMQRACVHIYISHLQSFEVVYTVYYHIVLLQLYSSHTYAVLI